MTKEVIAYYFVQDGGDGSASPRFFKTAEAAEYAMAQEIEEYGFTLTEGDVEEFTTDDFEDV